MRFMRERSLGSVLLFGFRMVWLVLLFSFELYLSVIRVCKI